MGAAIPNVLQPVEQFHSDASLEAVDQQAPNNLKNWQWTTVTSACNDQHLLHMAVNDHTASSRQLAAHWSTATGVLMSALSIHRHLLHRGLHARVSLYRIPLTANHQWLCLQWAHEQRAWQADWYQVVFSEESCFNLWDHYSCIHVRCYAGEPCLPESVIK
ncbi:transposable element Tcb1 transposase [Trichonephila clavipes]|uniref:Transposable element Tcb1 transposase n=1 Tax=Trichonephila clavipes TaxID=2585209 RepID=A0A8X6VEG2_TRICX|nr:transposable element Tcb1 transposase [Trichonephila clavipes]